ncbi:MAG: PP2C family protein-serine/threonine phosphatase [Lachnospiraceae bacterium]|nr:PP2C family protein-serine/threonine phosphatase [Lachnospiraceae bacterium]
METIDSVNTESGNPDRLNPENKNTENVNSENIIPESGIADNNSVKNKKGKKSHKIVVQIGLVIVVLFTLVIIAVGNMITMSSFSTALSSNITMFQYYMDNLSDNLEEYRSLTWLMDYWRDNSDELMEDPQIFNDLDYVDDLLLLFSKDSVDEVTKEEVESLSPEEQKRFAVYCYNDMLELFRMYQSDDDEVAIILTMTDDENEDPFVVLTNAPEDEEILLGQAGDINEINNVIATTEEAAKADVWMWAFSTPDQMMLLGSRMPFNAYKGSSTAEILGVFSAEQVYKQMLYTDHIRNDVIVMMILVLALILLCLYFIVPRPLEKVKECVSEYSNTKDTAALTQKLSVIRSKNEIGAFADEFSNLALEMERYTREMEKLAGERERVATELNVATNIQMQMLPQVFPENKKFTIFGSSVPAKEVGGDFYDCYIIDDDHLALTIADVSGKGVPAALFMAVSKTMLKNRTIVGGKPSEILRDVNNWLCEGNDSCMFVTVWHGILTISTGELISANAGHEYPGIRTEERFSLMHSSHGSPLGLVPGMVFDDEEYRLSPGDALFVYTDGVPEANASDESMFGEERLEAVLSTVTREDTPQIIMQKVKDAVDEFAGDTPQFDDLTMLCLVMKDGDIV